MMLHAAIALAIQAVIGFASGDWWLGGALAAGIFAGREHAQAEYRWIERYGSDLRANMPWHGGFQGRVWSAKSVADVLLPLAAISVVSIGAQTWK